MKIGFLGICEFGLTYLEHLLGRDLEVSFVTSKGAAQAHILEIEQRCKTLCKAKAVPYLGNADANHPEVVALASRTDICIMGGYDRILKTHIIDAPKLGVINTHLSLIPRHRGCYPIVWSILCDDSAGFTTYVVNKKIDFGIIVDQRKIGIGPQETAKNLYDRVSALAADAFRQKLDEILAWSWPEIALSDSTGSYHTAGMPNDRWISWHWRGEFLFRFSRSLSFPPYPGPRTILKHSGKEVQLFVVNHLPGTPPAAPGAVVDVQGDMLAVSCQDGTALCQIDLPNGVECIEKGMVFGSRQGGVHSIPLDYAQRRMLLAE